MKVTIPATMTRDDYDIDVSVNHMFDRIYESPKLMELLQDIFFEEETDIKVIGHALLSLCEKIKENAIEERIEELRQNKVGQNS